jgi:integrase
MDTISRVLAIQAKRTATTIVSYLAPAELDAVLAAPDQATWHGRRDHALLVLAAQTGLRVSEITGLAVQTRARHNHGVVIRIVMPTSALRALLHITGLIDHQHRARITQVLHHVATQVIA